VPDKDLKAVAGAFLEMHKDARGREVLHKASQEVGLDADAYFIPASGSDYAAYRRFYQSAPAGVR
jgi:phosphonate transport system substrate-binding protein